MGPALQVISQGGDAHIAPPPLARHRRTARLPLGGGCRRSRLGERKRRLLPFPLSALRAATSLAEGGKGRTDCRVASLLAMTALRAVGDVTPATPPVGADDSVRPRPAHPVGRGLRAPPGRMCLLRRDTWVPPYKSFRRGRCPHRPAAIWRGAANWGRENAAFCLSLRQRFALPPPSQREARGVTPEIRSLDHTDSASRRSEALQHKKEPPAGGSFLPVQG